MNLVVVTPPPVEPCTLEDLYTFLRMDPDGSPPSHPDDGMLETMLQTAREKIEATTRRALVQQRLRLIAGGFPSYRVCDNPDDDFAFSRDGYVELVRPPFIELHSVSYYDENNSLQVLNPTAYYIDQSEMVPRLQVSEGYSWPFTYRRSDALMVEYSVGYPPNGSPASDFVANIPASLIQAVQFEVQLQYDELTSEKRADIEKTIARLLRNFVVPRF